MPTEEMPTVGPGTSRKPRKKCHAYSEQLEKFINVVQKRSILLSIENRRSRVSNIDVYRALWHSSGVQMPSERVKKLALSRRLAAKVRVRNSRQRKEIRANLVALAASRAAEAERDLAQGTRETDENSMEVDRSSLSGGSKSANTVEMRSVLSQSSSVVPMSVIESDAGDNKDTASSFGGMSVDLIEDKTESAESLSGAGTAKEDDLDIEADDNEEQKGDETLYGVEEPESDGSKSDSESSKSTSDSSKSTSDSTESTSESCKTTSNSSNGTCNSDEGTSSTTESTSKSSESTAAISKPMSQKTTEEVGEVSSKRSLEVESLPDDDAEKKDSGSEWELTLPIDSEDDSVEKPPKISKEDAVDTVVERFAEAAIETKGKTSSKRSSREFDEETFQDDRANTFESPRKKRASGSPPIIRHFSPQPIRAPRQRTNSDPVTFVVSEDDANRTAFRKSSPKVSGKRPSPGKFIPPPEDEYTDL